MARLVWGGLKNASPLRSRRWLKALAARSCAHGADDDGGILGGIGPSRLWIRSSEMLRPHDAATSLRCQATKRARLGKASRDSLRRPTRVRVGTPPAGVDARPDAHDAATLTTSSRRRGRWASSEMVVMTPRSLGSGSAKGSAPSASPSHQSPEGLRETDATATRKGLGGPCWWNRPVRLRATERALITGR